MVGLWADGWFYISSAGLLVSGVLFIFLLGQYRIASEAADVTEVETGAEKDAHPAEAIRPVYAPEPSAPAPKVASHAEPAPAPKTPDAVAEMRRDPANTTGGLSPAVVYLQNIKTELAELHKEMNALAKRVDERLTESAGRDEALVERLGELARAVESMKSAAPATEAPAASLAIEQTSAPAPKRVKKAAEKAPEPVAAAEASPAPETKLDIASAVPAEPAPAPSPAPSPVIEPFPEPEPAPKRKMSDVERRAEETIRLDLSGLVAPAAKTETPAPAAEPAPATEPAPEAAAEEKPRRGPVWPV